ncbi:hypothetical protein FVE85_6913 [Porphyridium purpureum]|uniref:AAA+ ATPase domain-containing protein n=1 Tax=Porphyridium purpureum TaxID=35688 RepID=A0A5J4Z851_PORPP|nr:hypothetical protein FVE85_6913 [Porphyridium purpureum]|eukprot:POR0165..scf295_1
MAGLERFDRAGTGAARIAFALGAGPDVLLSASEEVSRAYPRGTYVRVQPRARYGSVRAGRDARAALRMVAARDEAEGRRGAAGSAKSAYGAVLDLAHERRVLHSALAQIHSLFVYHSLFKDAHVLLAFKSLLEALLDDELFMTNSPSLQLRLRLFRSYSELWRECLPYGGLRPAIVSCILASGGAFAAKVQLDAARKSSAHEAPPNEPPTRPPATASLKKKKGRPPAGPKKTESPPTRAPEHAGLRESLAQVAEQSSIPMSLLAATTYDLDVLRTLLEPEVESAVHALVSYFAPSDPHGNLRTPSRVRLDGMSDTVVVDANVQFLLDRAATSWTDDETLAFLKKCYAGQGSGVVGLYYGLGWDFQNRQLRGILSAQDVQEQPQLSFVGVEDIRRRLDQNTEFLMQGLRAQNVLLYGPPGCGKSTAVRSLLKQYGHRGLRLVELSKDELVFVPSIINELCKLPQKFILFIDDLSFDEGELDSWRAGKTALEGSLMKNAQNVAVYVTSNRRNPVGNPLTDGNNEKMAFSYRFGLTLGFPVTTRDQFLSIVLSLGESAGLIPHAPPAPRPASHREPKEAGDRTESESDDPAVILREAFCTRALSWALGSDGNGLSGRTARQFVEFTSSQAQLAEANNGMFEDIVQKKAFSEWGLNERGLW